MGSTPSRLASFIYPILIASTCSLVACGGGGGGDNTPPPDTTPPTATIVFPPPVSATIGNTITVRGTASDDRSDVTGVRVNNVDAQSNDGFATWTVNIDILPDQDNPITVSVTDAENNTDAAAATAMIQQQTSDRVRAFPADYGEAFTSLNEMALDIAGQRLFNCGARAIYEVSLVTGQREILFDNTTQNVVDLNGTPPTCIYEQTSSRHRLWMASRDRVFYYDFIANNVVLLSDNNTPNSGPQVSFFRTGFIDDAQNRLIVGDATENAPTLMAVDLDTGIRTVLMDLLDDTLGEPAAGTPNFVIPSTDNNSLLYLANDLINDSKVFKIDLNSNTREVISSNTIPNADAPLLDRPSAFILHASNNRLYVANALELNVISVSVDISNEGVRGVIFGPDFTGGQNSINQMGRLSGYEFDEVNTLLYISDSNFDSIYLVDLQSRSDVVLTAN